jgi:transcriptional regulator with XRE-family HTH domain
MPFSPADFGKRLRRIRRAKDLTQQELGKKADIHYTTISRLEAGDATQIYADTVVRLAEALGVNPDRLLRGEEDEGDVEPAAVAWLEPSTTAADMPLAGTEARRTPFERSVTHAMSQATHPMCHAPGCISEG